MMIARENQKTMFTRIVRALVIVAVGGLVACSAGFKDQSKVVNGASELFVSLFGDAGRHARTALGVTALPADMAVEIEAIVSLRGS